MDYHQNARLTVHSRERLARVVEQGWTLRAAARAFHVSEKTAAKWVRRYRQFGPDGLEDRSSKPHRSPRQTPSTLLEKAFELRRQRRNGWYIAHELKLSRATVSRILRRAGLNRLRSLDPPPPVVRYEHKHPGDLTINLTQCKEFPQSKYVRHVPGPYHHHQGGPLPLGHFGKFIISNELSVGLFAKFLLRLDLRANSSQ